MDLREFTADDAEAIRLAVDIENRRNAIEAPWEPPVTAYRMERNVRYGWDGEPDRYFLAHDGDTVVGLGQIGCSEWDNLDLAWLDLKILPEHLRQGHGSSLLERLLGEVTAMGRHLVGANAWDGTPGHAFALGHGFAHKAQDIKRRMHLSEAPIGEVRRLRDEAAAAAASYELVRLAGRTPDDLLEAVVGLTAAINDAPLDDLEYEDEEFSPARIRDLRGRGDRERLAPLPARGAAPRER